MTDTNIIRPKAIYGCIGNEESEVSFSSNSAKSKQVSSFYWDSGTKAFAYRFSKSIIADKSQPYHDNRFVVLFEGRVDEIIGEKIFSSRQNITDRKLISCYLKYGKDLPNRMYGDWSFAIYDCKLDELFISRDHNGNSVIHYYMYKNRFQFATLLGDLLDDISICPVLDERRIIDVHTTRNLKGESTYYKDVFRLPPGTSLIYNKGNIKLVPYWFPENLPKIVYRNDSDYYDHFSQLFYNAVNNRIRLSLRPAVALSGGLDSGAVASVAATILSRSNRKLQTYTAIPAFDIQDQYLDRITNEWPIVLSLVKRYNNIEAVKFNSLNFSPIQTAKRAISIFREPVWAVANYNWIFDLYERTEANNNDTLLFGAMGNRTISWPYPGSKFGWNDLLIQDMKRIYSLIFRRKVFMDRISNASLLRASIIRRHVSINTVIRNHYPLSIFDLNSILYKTLKLRNNYVNSEMKTTSILFNTNIVDPTNDRSIMEFVLKIPARIFSNVDGSRLLVRKGLKEYLPQEYLDNTIKGIQSGDINQRLELFKNELLKDLNNAKSNQFLSNYFDFAKIDQLIVDVKSDNVALNPVNNLMRYIGTLNFLRQFE